MHAFRAKNDKHPKPLKIRGRFFEFIKNDPKIFFYRKLNPGVRKVHNHGFDDFDNPRYFTGQNECLHRFQHQKRLPDLETQCCQFFFNISIHVPGGDSLRDCTPLSLVFYLIFLLRVFKAPLL